MKNIINIIDRHTNKYIWQIIYLELRYPLPSEIRLKLDEKITSDLEAQLGVQLIDNMNPQLG